MTTAGKSMTSALWVLAVFIVAVAAAAVIGGIAASHASEIYGNLKQPVWAPPSWLFGPVWTVLYLLLAVSGWLYWRADGTRSGLVLYGVGLVLNAAWTPLFFAGGAYTVALIDIIVLDVVLALTLVVFLRRSALAMSLQIPYLAWTLFATALNAAIIVLN